MFFNPIIADMTVNQGVAIIVPAIVAIGIAIGGLIIQTSRRNRDKIDTLALDVALLKQQISPFWASLQSKIADSLHHPGAKHKELDNLLEKLKALTLTPEEKIILESTLQKLVETAPIDAAEKASALLKVMPMVEKEAAGELPPTDQRTIEQKKEAERINGAPA